MDTLIKEKWGVLVVVKNFATNEAGEPLFYETQEEAAAAAELPCGTCGRPARLPV